MTATLPARPAPVPSLRPPVAGPGDQRPRLQAELASHEQQARTAASVGDLDGSARAILAALDCERRLAGVGPQVLQVIKPRS